MVFSIVLEWNTTLSELLQSSAHFLSNSEYLAPIWTYVNAYQLLIDVLLLIFSLYVLFRKPAASEEKPLTEKEIAEIIDAWEPEPLIPEITPLMELDNEAPLIEKSTTTHVTIKGREVFNLARQNFLGMVNNPKTEAAALKTLQTYGTGTCGPRGFNGTIDVHLNLEKRIKEFMNAEDCCIYSFGFATVSSAIPAFSARGDLLIVDKGVSYALQTGVKLSRSDVIWYEHNDMKDLERILKQVDQEDKKTKRKIPRRFIVTEGLFFNHGDVAPLDKIMELKQKYYYRIVLDDSYGLGVLGKTGRGTCELYNINPRDIDILTGNLEGATSSVGGFCCGARNVIYHQRLNSSGYVYSCSLPPLLASASIAALDILEEDPGLITKLAENTKYFVNGLKNISGVTVTSSMESPIIHLRLSKVPPQNEKERLTQERTLENIVKESLNRGILLTRAKYVHHYEYFMPVPSIRICVSAVHTKEQLQNALNIIKESTEKALKNNNNKK